jgi:hypothetical protein
MYKYAAVVLVIIALMSFVSCASGHAGDIEMPTGDVWPSREELIYIPPAAIVPTPLYDGAMPWENPAPLSDTIPFESTRTTSNHEPNRAARRASIRSGKNCTPRHGRLAGGATQSNCKQRRRLVPYPAGA